jgi:hypothetical protein
VNIKAMAIDQPGGGVYASGDFGTSFSITLLGSSIPTPLTPNSDGSDMFAIKLDSNMNPIWAKR